MLDLDKISIKIDKAIQSQSPRSCRQWLRASRSRRAKAAYPPFIKYGIIRKRKLAMTLAHEREVFWMN